MGKLCVSCQTSLQGQQQKYCSNACKQKDHWNRVKTQTNTYHSQTVRALRRKIQLIQLAGGACRRCGYNANLAALHLHHVDSETKSLKLDSRMLSNRTWASLVDEVEKCELLCSNCHAEEHHPELTFSNVERMIRGASRWKRRDVQGVNSGEPDRIRQRMAGGNPEPSQANGQNGSLEGAETTK